MSERRGEITIVMPLKGNVGITIIYCITRDITDNVSKLLKSKGIDVDRYHAGLKDEERDRFHERFSLGQYNIVCSTNALGMGFDLPNISQVIHYGSSQSLVSYYQEIGRAGRNGEPAKCILFYEQSDFDIQSYLIERSYTSHDVIEYHKEELNLIE